MMRITRGKEVNITVTFDSDQLYLLIKEKLQEEPNLGDLMEGQFGRAEDVAQLLTTELVVKQQHFVKVK